MTSRLSQTAFTALLCMIVSISLHAEDLKLKSAYHDVIGSKVTESAGEDSLLSALLDGTPTGQLLLAYEYSDLDDGASADPGEGLTLRTRINYQTGTWLKSSAFVQWQHHANIIENFVVPGGRGGEAGHDAIAELDGNSVHQAYVDINAIDDTRIRIGLQEIIMDDARLIGNVGWRTNAQSFNGISIQNNSIEDLTLYAAFIEKFRNIHLEDVDTIEDLVLLNGRYKFSDELTVATFAYLLDADAAASDSATYGVRATGAAGGFNYDVTVATQEDYADISSRDGDMFNALVTYKLDGITLGAGYSYISGGTGVGDTFETLYSTAHKFNGWADQFLATNTGGGVLTGGLEDMYVQAGGKLGKKSSWLIRYHFFDTTNTAANGFDGEYGTELDALLKFSLSERVNALVKYAWYNETEDAALNPTADEQVLWVRLEYKF